MTALQDLSGPALAALREETKQAYNAFCARGIKLDMTRGKPSTEQVALADGMLRLPGNGDHLLADGGDARNYYGTVQGIPEVRALFADFIGAPVEQMVAGNNSSLALMHDTVVFALLKGVPDGGAPWAQLTDGKPATFLCPVPGYDRHFAICEQYGIRMIPVPLTGDGPDMDAVEAHVGDPAVKGIWCVPKYSNPTGEIYSDNVVARLAAMATAAPDFRIFWDNAYAVHHLTESRHQVANILEACREAGTENRPFIFASTSKITFAGGGVSFFAGSAQNLAWYRGCLAKRSIGPDKLNQLRHVRFFGDAAGVIAHMDRQRALVAPKFAAVDAALEHHLAGTGAAVWTKPAGGYFVSVDTIAGAARQAIAYAADAGIAMVPAGATFPYGRDPEDKNIRIAPTYPSLADVEIAMEGIALSILLAAIEAVGAPSATE